MRRIRGGHRAFQAGSLQEALIVVFICSERVMYVGRGSPLAFLHTLYPALCSAQPAELVYSVLAGKECTHRSESAVCVVWSPAGDTDLQVTHQTCIEVGYTDCSRHVLKVIQDVILIFPILCKKRLWSDTC